LIVRPVHAIGKIARGLGYAYVRFLHNLIIGLSDFLPMSSKSRRGDHYLVQYWFRNLKTSSAQTSDPK
jgi:hypothetical protein